MNYLEIRRQNLRRMMEEVGAKKLAARLGYKQSSFLSQMCGPNPTRMVTEKTARLYEKTLGLQHGALDRPPQPAAQVLPEDVIAMVLTATSTLGKVIESEAMVLPPTKFASVLSMVIKDAVAHGEVRETYVKEVVELLK